MKMGVFMESHLGRSAPCVLSLSLLLIQLCQAAPGQPGTQREEAVDAHPPLVALANPFGSGEEERRFLQSYVQSSLKEDQGGPEIRTWEQEVFFLFRLYDFDRSELLDGLEMMKLLSVYNSHHTPGKQTNELVVSMVDFLLQTQDINQDGLLAPSELLSPSLPHKQDSSNNKAPHQDEQEEEQKVAAEEKLSNQKTDKEEEAGGAEQGEQAHQELLLQDEDKHQQEVKKEEEELINQVDKQQGQQIPEAQAAEHGQHHQVPVHQGQPEM